MSNLRNEEIFNHADEFDQVLDSCLNMLQSGDSVDLCLGRYPAWAADLRPILELSVQVMTVPAPRMSAPAVDSNRSKMLATVENQSQSAQSSGLLTFLQPVSFSNFGRYAGQLYQFLTGTEVTPAMKMTRALALMAALIFSFAFTLNASADSLPGDVLYSVKRLSEETQELLAPPNRASELRKAQAGNRLNELDALQAQNRDATLTIDGEITVIGENKISVGGLEIELDESSGLTASAIGESYSSVQLRISDGQVALLSLSNDNSNGPTGYPGPAATETAQPPVTLPPTETPEASATPIVPEPTSPSAYPYPYPEPEATPVEEAPIEEAPTEEAPIDEELEELDEAIEACLALDDEAEIDSCLDDLFDEIDPDWEDPIDPEKVEACLVLEDEAKIDSCLDDLFAEAYPEVAACLALPEETEVEKCLDDLDDEVFPGDGETLEPIDPIDPEQVDACFALEDEEAVQQCLDDLHDELFPDNGETPEHIDPIDSEQIDICLDLEGEEAIQQCLDDLHDEFFPDDGETPEPTDPIDPEQVDACFALEGEEAVQKCLDDLHDELFPDNGEDPDENMPEPPPAPEQPEPPQPPIPGGYPEPPTEAPEFPPIELPEVPNPEFPPIEIPEIPTIDPPKWDDDSENGENGETGNGGGNGEEWDEDSFEFPEPPPEWGDEEPDDEPDYGNWNDEEDEDEGND